MSLIALKTKSNAFKYLEVHFGLVLPKGGYAGEQGFALDPGLGEDQEQSPDQSQVTEQELQVPQNTVRDRLKHDTVSYLAMYKLATPNRSDLLVSLMGIES